LVLNPSDSLSDGDIVTIVADEVKKDNKPVEIPQKAKP